MRPHSGRTLSLATAVIVLAAGAAGAQGNKKEKGEKGGQGKAKVEQTERHRDDGRVVMRDGRQVIIRDGDRDAYGNGRKVPPGLAKKPGQMPPGQYKKRYETSEGASVLGDIFKRRGYTVVRTVPYGDSRYVYYRLSDGSERRAVVSQGTDRLVFRNVPESLLREVVARLY